MRIPGRRSEGGRNRVVVVFFFLLNPWLSPCGVAAEWLPLRPKVIAAAKTGLSTWLSFPELP